MFRVRLAAIEAARVLGDERLVGPLSGLPFLDGREKRNAREAVRALRAHGGQAKELADLRRDVDKLKDETKALREKLDGPSAKPRRAGRSVKRT